MNNKSSGKTHFFVVIVMIIAICLSIALGLIIWQEVYNRSIKKPDGSGKTVDQNNNKDQNSELAKSIDKTQATEQNKLCADKAKARQEALKKQPESAPDDDPTCTDQNKQLRIDVAVAAAGAQAMHDDDIKTPAANSVLYAKNQDTSGNIVIKPYLKLLSKNTNSIKVVDNIDATIVGNMDFGDMLVVKYSKCLADKTGAVMNDPATIYDGDETNDTMTVLTRFYNTPIYYCQDVVQPKAKASNNDAK